MPSDYHRNIPKFDHANPLAFFSLFIAFCQATKCGEPLSAADGRIASIQSLDEQGYEAALAATTPTRADFAARTPRATRAGAGAARTGRGRAAGADDIDAPLMM